MLVSLCTWNITDYTFHDASYWKKLNRILNVSDQQPTRSIIHYLDLSRKRNRKDSEFIYIINTLLSRWRKAEEKEGVFATHGFKSRLV